MSDATHSLPFRSKRVRPYAGRGEVYSWLRAHHRAVQRVLAREERTWSDLAQELARAGVKGRNGGGLTANAVLRVWQRVCRDLEAEVRAPGPPRPGAKYPSRISPNWRPQEVVGPPPPIPFQMPADKPSDALASVMPAEPVDAEGFTAEERERIAKMQAKAGALFAEHDAKFKF